MRRSLIGPVKGAAWAERRQPGETAGRVRAQVASWPAEVAAVRPWSR
jgi:hypothetical protein